MFESEMDPAELLKIAGQFRLSQATDRGFREGE
jgi:hypothetical protein